MDANLRMSNYQRDVLLSEHPFIISSNGIGSGKSYAAAIIGGMDLCKGRSSLCVSQSYRALKDVLFPAIIDVLNTLGVKYYYNKSSYQISLTNANGYHPRIIGRSAENPDGIRGVTQVSNYLGDEAALYDPQVHTICVGRLRGEFTPRIRLFTTPRGGQNYVSHLTTRSDVLTMRTTIFQNPYVTKEQRDLILSNYEEGTDLYNQEILGLIVNSDFTTAILRLEDFASTCLVSSTSLNDLVLSIDFARDGVDSTILTLRNEYRILDKVQLGHADTSEIMSKFHMIEMKYGKQNIKQILYDSTGGYHIGFEDAAKGTHTNLQGVNFGGPSPDPNFANNRAYIYYLAAQSIKGGFYVQDPLLKEELRVQQWIIDGKGKRALIPKKSIKTILGRSCDSSDSFAVGYWKPYTPAGSIKSLDYYKNIIGNIK